MGHIWKANTKLWTHRCKRIGTPKWLIVLINITDESKTKKKPQKTLTFTDYIHQNSSTVIHNNQLINASWNQYLFNLVYLDFFPKNASSHLFFSDSVKKSTAKKDFHRNRIPCILSTFFTAIYVLWKSRSLRSLEGYCYHACKMLQLVCILWKLMRTHTLYNQPAHQKCTCSATLAHSSNTDFGYISVHGYTLWQHSISCIARQRAANKATVKQSTAVFHRLTYL